MKKFLSAILVGTIFLTAMSVVFAAGYVGNRNSKIFHYSDCKWVDKMQFENQVIFSSRDEAIGGGYRTCKKCSP